MSRPTGTHRILLLDPIDEAARNELKTRHHLTDAIGASSAEIHSLAADSTAIILRSGAVLDGACIDVAADLRLVVRAGSGIDNIDTARLEERGIPLHRIDQPGARSVAEHCLALLLALARRIPEADASLRNGSWRKRELTGSLLVGRTVGVIGAGSIGTTFARLARAIGLGVNAHVAHRTPQRQQEFASEGIRLMDLDELLGESDIVSVHVPLSESTHHLISATEIDLIGPSGLLINVSRGGVVDEQALHAALRDGRIAGAGIDVFCEEGSGVPLFADLPNVVMTPHLGSSTHETQSLIGKTILEIFASSTTTDPSTIGPRS